MTQIYPLEINGSDSHGPQMMLGFVDRDFVYGTWVKLNSYPLAYKWNRFTGDLVTFDLSTISGNPMNLPTYDVTDGHYAYTTGVAPNADGTKDEVFIDGNHHDASSTPDPTTHHLVKCIDVDDFTNPASWVLEDNFFGPRAAVDNPALYTYTFFDRLSDGTLIMAKSQSENLGNSRGRDFLMYKRTEGVWSAVVSDGHFATTNAVDDGTAPGDEANRVYITEMYVDANDRLHVTGIFRYADDDATTSNSPWYLYSDGPLLNEWHHKSLVQSNEDTPRAMPLTWANRTDALITGAPVTSHSHRKSLYVDPVTGFPRVILRDQGNNRYYAYEWTSTGWVQSAQLPLQGGAHRDELWRGQRWRRSNSGNRLTLIRASGGLTIRVGPPIKTAGVVYSANPEPILLREEDTYLVCIAEDGDTPAFWSLGGVGVKGF